MAVTAEWLVFGDMGGSCRPKPDICHVKLDARNLTFVQSRCELLISTRRCPCWANSRCPKAVARHVRIRLKATPPAIGGPDSLFANGCSTSRRLSIKRSVAHRQASDGVLPLIHASTQSPR